MSLSESGASPSPRLLLVDDSAEDRQTFRRFLTKDATEAYVITEAASLAEARQRAAFDNPDCVLLDFNLPDGTGLSLLRELLGAHGRHAFGVIMLTGSGETQVAVDALKSGAHDYIDKNGLTPLRLRQTVANAISQAELHRRIDRQNVLLAERNEALARELARTHHEIAERTRAQQALSESEAFLQSVISAQVDCVKVLDLEGRLQWINEPGKRMLGINSLADLPDLRWTSFWHDPVQQKEAVAAIEQARNGQVANFSGSTAISPHAGKWWDVALAPILGTDGRAKRLLCVSRDVTSAVEASRAVREKESQLRLVSDHVPVSIAQFDRQFRYRFGNRRIATRYALEPDQLVGRALADVIGREYFEKARPMMEQALAGQRVDFEIQSPASQGSRWFQVSYVPEYGSGGDVIGFVAVSTDITDRRHAELELERARDEAVQATRTRDDFLAALSHELRTPLNPALLLASDAAEDPSIPPELRRRFAAIRHNVQLEARLIDDLLDLSRIAHGKLTLDARDIELQDVIREAVVTVNADIAAKHIELAVSLPESPIRLRGDPVRLQQVFWNILKNAAKFTPDNGRVTITATTNDSRVAVSIRDSGLGISAEDLPKIFAAFAQGQHAKAGSAQRFGGLGLGLAITQRLVDLHHGTIRAESAGLQRGSTFVVELPILRSPRTARAEATPVAPLSGPSPGGEGVHILIVEDHAATRESLGFLLKRRGYRVTLASSAMTARAAADADVYSLVISDIGLPDSDGYTLLHELRSQQPHLRSIALSGYGSEEDRARSSEAGFDSHITKPVTISMLEQALADVLALPAKPAQS